MPSPPGELHARRQGRRWAILTGPITANRTLFADTVYTLSGYVKVQNGVTLTIPAGTTIVGDTTQPGSSLWILRGAKIDAQGTADRSHRLHLGPLCRQPEAG